MNAEYLHIAVVLDASGSMGSLESDTKGSFNSFVADQRKTEGKTVFELWQFNTDIDQVVQPTDLASVPDDLMNRYRCGGGTAMNDAICTAIDDLGERFAAMPESDRPGDVMVVIITDGEENSSRKFTAGDVKTRIEHQRDVYNWKFIFLAANQDAFVAGERIGMAKADCTRFEASPEGMCSNQQLVAYCAQSIRSRRKK